MTPQIQTREELASLITNLATQDTSKWENGDLSSFLEALGAWINDCDGYYTNRESTINPNKANWQLIADALQAASIYE